MSGSDHTDPSKPQLRGDLFCIISEIFSKSILDILVKSFPFPQGVSSFRSSMLRSRFSLSFLLIALTVPILHQDIVDSLLWDR